MRTYEFDIFVQWEGLADVEFLAKLEEPLFEAFQGDVTPAVMAGRPYVSATLEADSLEAAIRRVIEILKAEGMEPDRLQMDHAEMAMLLAA